jgi:hypothetical protein
VDRLPVDRRPSDSGQQDQWHHGSCRDLPALRHSRSTNARPVHALATRLGACVRQSCPLQGCLYPGQSSWVGGLGSSTVRLQPGFDPSGLSEPGGRDPQAATGFDGQEWLPARLNLGDGRTEFRLRVWAEFWWLLSRCRGSPPAVSGTKSSSRTCGGCQATDPPRNPRSTTVFRMRSRASGFACRERTRWYGVRPPSSSSGYSTGRH